MNLAVAVETQKDAFLELLPEAALAPVVAAGETESLRTALDVMETKRSQAPLVAAKLASPAFVVDHLPLESHTVDAPVRTTRVASPLAVPLAVVVGIRPSAELAMAHVCVDVSVRNLLRARMLRREHAFDGTYRLGR